MSLLAKTTMTLVMASEMSMVHGLGFLSHYETVVKCPYFADQPVIYQTINYTESNEVSQARIRCANCGKIHILKPKFSYERIHGRLMAVVKAEDDLSTPLCTVPQMPMVPTTTRAPTPCWTSTLPMSVSQPVYASVFLPPLTRSLPTYTQPLAHESIEAPKKTGKATPRFRSLKFKDLVEAAAKGENIEVAIRVPYHEGKTLVEAMEDAVSNAPPGEKETYEMVQYLVNENDSHKTNQERTGEDIILGDKDQELIQLTLFDIQEVWTPTVPTIRYNIALDGVDSKLSLTERLCYSEYWFCYPKATLGCEWKLSPFHLVKDSDFHDDTEGKVEG